ncbi:polysaccharide deacetylase family protein [Variovorax sp. HJSM1_2]|uniref:polysaccharide deacetylase family protein n=1 Tax=Variovorax sp. HJSM1_2 TaxID=3366263 RepID=UPI003BC25B94
MLLRAFFNVLSPAGAKAKLSTLIFHRVHAQPDPLFPGEVDAAQFNDMCRWLKEWCNVLPLDLALAQLADGSLPARACAITFDDGYADNHDVALPILQKHGLVATFFIATGFLDGGRMWNDGVIEALRSTERPVLQLASVIEGMNEPLPLADWGQKRAAIYRILAHIKYLPLQVRDEAVAALARYCAVTLPDDLMMTSDQVRGLHRAGMQIGAHTVSHPILAKQAQEDMYREIVQGKEELERLIDAPVALFAYPNGKPDEDYSATSVDIVKSLGFQAAVSTEWGVGHRESDLFQIPRFTPWDRSAYKFGLRLGLNMRKTQTLRASGS